jgi:hypothetical protein
VLKATKLTLPTEVYPELRSQDAKEDDVRDTDTTWTLLRFQSICITVADVEFRSMLEYGKSKKLPTDPNGFPRISHDGQCGTTRKDVRLLYAVMRQTLMSTAAALVLAVDYVVMFMKKHVALLPFSVIGAPEHTWSMQKLNDERQLKTSTIVDYFNKWSRQNPELWTKTLVRKSIAKALGLMAEIQVMAQGMKELEKDMDPVLQNQNTRGTMLTLLKRLCSCDVDFGDYSTPDIDILLGQNYAWDDIMVTRVTGELQELNNTTATEFLQLEDADATHITWSALTKGVVPYSVLEATRAMDDKDRPMYVGPFDYMSFPRMFALNDTNATAVSAPLPKNASPPQVVPETLASVKSFEYVSQMQEYAAGSEQVAIFQTAVRRWFADAFDQDVANDIITHTLTSQKKFELPWLRSLIKAATDMHQGASGRTIPTPRKGKPKVNMNTGRADDSAGQMTNRVCMMSPADSDAITALQSQHGIGILTYTEMKTVIVNVLGGERSHVDFTGRTADYDWQSQHVEPVHDQLALALAAAPTREAAALNGGQTTCRFGGEAVVSANVEATLYWPAQLYSVDLMYKFLFEITRSVAGVIHEQVKNVVHLLDVAVKNNLIHEVLWASARFEKHQDIDLATYYKDGGSRARDAGDRFPFQTALVFQYAKEMHQLVQLTIDLCTFGREVSNARVVLRSQCRNVPEQDILAGPREALAHADNVDNFWLATMPSTTRWGQAPEEKVIHLTYRDNLKKFASFFERIENHTDCDPILATTDMTWNGDAVRNLSSLRELFALSPRRTIAQIDNTYRSFFSQLVGRLISSSQRLEVSDASYEGSLESLLTLPPTVIKNIPLKEVQLGGGRNVDDIVRFAATHESKFDQACEAISTFVNNDTFVSIHAEVAKLVQDEPDAGFSPASANIFIQFQNDYLERFKLGEILVDTQLLTDATLQPSSFRKVGAKIVDRLNTAMTRIIGLPFMPSDVAGTKQSAPANPPPSADEQTGADKPESKFSNIIITVDDNPDDGKTLSVWSYNQRGLTKYKSATVEQQVGLSNLNFVQSPALLTETGGRDNLIAFEEARLVTGDGDDADVLNHMKVVQVITMLLSYTPFVASGFFKQGPLRHENLEALVYYLDNRMQMKPASDMAMWTAALNATYTLHPGWLKMLMTSLRGVEHENAIHLATVDVPCIAGNLWAAEFVKTPRSKHQFHPPVPRTEAPYCIYEFKSFKEDPAFKPSLEDMRAIMIQLCAENAKPDNKRNKIVVYPLCYLYTMHTANNKSAARRQSQTFRVIDSTHQIRENAETRVHLMLAALNPDYAVEWHRTLHNMPVRVCPMCGLVRSDNSMTSDDFENHFFADRYQCASIRLFEDNPDPSPFQVSEVSRLRLKTAMASIMKALRNLPVWRSVVATFYNDQKRLSDDKIMDLLDELEETLTPPLVRGRNPFFVALERGAQLAPSAFDDIQQFVQKILPQFTRLIKILKREPQAIMKWAMPRLLAYHSRKATRSDAPPFEGYPRAILWNAFVQFTVKKLLLHLPMSCFTAPGLNNSGELSVVGTLLQASNRPSASRVDYFSKSKLDPGVCRILKRTKLASDALTRDAVMAKRNAAIIVQNAQMAKARKQAAAAARARPAEEKKAAREAKIAAVAERKKAMEEKKKQKKKAPRRSKKVPGSVLSNLLPMPDPEDGDVVGQEPKAPELQSDSDDENPQPGDVEDIDAMLIPTVVVPIAAAPPPAAASSAAAAPARDETDADYTQVNSSVYSMEAFAAAWMGEPAANPIVFNAEIDELDINDLTEVTNDVCIALGDLLQ